MDVNHGMEVPFTKRVIEKGRLPKWDENKQVPTGIGFFAAASADFRENSLSSHLWSFLKLHSLRQGPAPAGWRPEREIVGIFEPYRDYLMEARNPEDMKYRKQLVISHINYQVKMSRSGALKKLGAGIVAFAVDPFTYVLGGVFGKAAGSAVSRFALNQGIARMGEAAIIGAGDMATYDIASTALKKGMGASPENPEFHVISSIIGGAIMGGFGGLLSEGAGFSKFKQVFGKKDYAAYTELDKRMRMHAIGMDEFSSSPERQIEFHKLLLNEVDAYLRGDLDTQKFRIIDIDAIGGNSAKNISALMGWKGKVVDLTSIGEERLWRIFSNKGRLLTSSNDMVAATGMKIFATDFSSRRLKPLIGEEIPLETQVARGITSSMYSYKTLGDRCWNEAKTAGFEGTRNDFTKEVVRAIHYGDVKNATDPVKKMAEGLQKILDVPAKLLHERGGFESQIQMRQAHEQKIGYLQKEIRNAKEELRNGKGDNEETLLEINIAARAEAERATELVDAQLLKIAKFVDLEEVPQGATMALEAAFRAKLREKIEHATPALKGWLLDKFRVEWKKYGEAVDLARDAEVKFKAASRELEAARIGAVGRSEEGVPFNGAELEAKIQSLKQQIIQEISDFEKAYKEFTLDVAKNKLGGGFYLPRSYDFNLVCNDYKEAAKAFTDNYIKSYPQKIQQGLARINDDVISQLSKDSDLSTKNMWAKYKQKCGDRYVNAGDIYENPISKEMSVEEALEVLRSRNFTLKKEFFKEAEEEGIYRVRAIMDKKMNHGVAGPERPVTFRGLANEPVEVELRAYGSAKRRIYNDDMEIVGKYLNYDLNETMYSYMRSMHSSVGMIDVFGDTHGLNWMNQVKRAMREEEEKIPDGPRRAHEILRMKARHDKELIAIGTAMDHIRGISSVEWGLVGDKSAVKSLMNIGSSWNVARFLSDSVFSQLQDVANVALHGEGWITIGRHVANFFKGVFDPVMRRVYREQINEFGVGGSVFMENLRYKPLIEVSDAGGLLGKAEKLSGKLANATVKYSGVGYLDAFTQSSGTYMATNDLRRIAYSIKKGKKLTSYQERFVNENRLSLNDMRVISSEIDRHSEFNGDVFRINVSAWDNQKLADRCRAIFHRIGVSSTMIPGAELPSIFKTPLGKFFFQFKTFGTATFGKLFLPSLERGHAVMSDVFVQCLALDFVSKICKEFGKFVPRKKKDPITGQYRYEDTTDKMMRLWGDTITSTDWTAWALVDPTGFTQTLLHGGDYRPEMGGTFGGLIGDIYTGVNFVSKSINNEKTTDAERAAMFRLLPFQNFWVMRAGVVAMRKFFGNTKAEANLDE
jgi:hypothetical protein